MKVCTPIDRRFTPACANARKRSFSNVPGLASIVISQSAASGSSMRRSDSRRAMPSGENSDGVPPPMKIVWIVRPQTMGSERSRSARTASR